MIVKTDHKNLTHPASTYTFKHQQLLLENMASTFSISKVRYLVADALSRLPKGVVPLQ
jgi:hypothetical protein